MGFILGECIDVLKLMTPKVMIDLSAVTRTSIALDESDHPFLLEHNDGHSAQWACIAKRQRILKLGNESAEPNVRSPR